jgi:hypothetical protein
MKGDIYPEARHCKIERFVVFSQTMIYASTMQMNAVCVV